MRNRRSFHPSCSMIETLEDRKMLDGTIGAPPMAMAPAAPSDLAPVLVGTPLLDKTITNNPNFNIPVVAIGNPGQQALVSTVATATNTLTGQQFQQGGSTMIPGVGPTEVSVAVDMNDLPPGNYTVTLEVFDGSMQDMEVQSSVPVNVQVIDQSVPEQNMFSWHPPQPLTTS